MGFWPNDSKLEGRLEIYLRWKNVAINAIMLAVPLGIALYFDSLIVKIICWMVVLFIHMTAIRTFGPCAMAVTVGVVPWYIYFELDYPYEWMALTAIIVSSIELSYIRHRLKFSAEMRKKEGIPEL